MKARSLVAISSLLVVAGTATVCSFIGASAAGATQGVPVTTSTTAASATSAEAQTPAHVVAAFYHWYLAQMAADTDPWEHDLDGLSAFVAPGLIEDIQRQRTSPGGLDEDYFIKSQDYLDSWTTQIVTKPISAGGRFAVVNVTLGKAPDDHLKLRVTLVAAGKAWKILKVVERE